MNGNALKLRRTIEKHSIIGIDTAPFIYFIEDVSPYADLLEPVFDLLGRQSLKAVTSTVTLAEILAKPFAEKNFKLVDETKFALRSFTSLSMKAVDEKLAEAAALIRARYALRLPDALQIAATVEAGATLFLTNDKSVKKIDAVEVVVLSDFV